MTKLGFYKEYRMKIQYGEINIIHKINRLSKKNHKIMTIDAIKGLDKILHSYGIKPLSKLRIEQKILIFMKSICKKPTKSAC